MKKKKVEIDYSNVYVRDDLAHAWYYSPNEGKIKCVLADLEADSEEERQENGYCCDSFEHGISLLNEYGYITGEDNPNANHVSVWEELKEYVGDDDFETYADLKSHAEEWYGQTK